MVTWISRSPWAVRFQWLEKSIPSEDGWSFIANALRSRTGKFFSQADLKSIRLSISTRKYAVSDYTVDVIVAGTASKPEIKLQSQPQLAQADILSLILFGTTTSQLGQGQKTTLQQQAQSMAAGAAGQALSESLGLASLGVDVNGESVGLGHYLNENTYVSVSPSLGANGSKIPSQVASIQYFLRRWLTITTATMSDGSRQVFLNVNKRY